MTNNWNQLRTLFKQAIADSLNVESAKVTLELISSSTRRHLQEKTILLTVHTNDPDAVSTKVQNVSFIQEVNEHLQSSGISDIDEVVLMRADSPVVNEVGAATNVDDSNESNNIIGLSIPVFIIVLVVLLVCIVIGYYIVSKDSNSKEYDDSRRAPKGDPTMDEDPQISIHPQRIDEEIEAIESGGNNIELIEKQLRQEGVEDPTSMTFIHHSVTLGLDLAVE